MNLQDNIKKFYFPVCKILVTLIHFLKSRHISQQIQTFQRGSFSLKYYLN